MNGSIDSGMSMDALLSLLGGDGTCLDFPIFLRMDCQTTIDCMIVILGPAGGGRAGFWMHP
jgi:hypothetical protein